mgnify:FL=1
MKKANFVIKRLLLVIPLLIVISVLAFILSNLSSGDVASVAIRNEGGIVNDITLAAKREELGLNKPLAVQYLNWLQKAIRLDFGTSFTTKKPVIYEIGRRFPATLALAVTATLIAVICALPLALISAGHPGKIIDHIIRFFTLIGATMPNFWLGLMLLYFFAIQLGVVPVISGNKLSNIFLPAFVMSLEHMALYTRLLRGSILQVMDSGYIRAARTKGLSYHAVMMKHALRNAVLPCMTLIATNLSGLICGSFAIETIFSWNGIGKFAVESVKAKDLPVVEGYIVTVALTYIVINLIMDILYSYINPKIQLGRNEIR